MGGRGEAEQRGYLFPHLDCIREPETALAHETNPDDARAHALVKAPEDPPAPGPLLQ